MLLAADLHDLPASTFACKKCRQNIRDDIVFRERKHIYHLWAFDKRHTRLLNLRLGKYYLVYLTLTFFGKIVKLAVRFSVVFEE